MSISLNVSWLECHPIPCDCAGGALGGAELAGRRAGRRGPAGIRNLINERGLYRDEDRRQVGAVPCRAVRWRGALHSRLQISPARRAYCHSNTLPSTGPATEARRSGHLHSALP